MDLKKYERAVEINKKIENLQYVKAKIEQRGAWLNYSYKNIVNDHDGFTNSDIQPIKEILKAHECMIMRDIDRAIEYLEKAIKEL